MIKFIIGVLALITASTSFAGVSLDDDAIYEMNKRMGYPAFKHSLGNMLDEKAKVVKVVYDAGIGDYGSSTVSSGVHGLGTTLPAGAIITRSWLQIAKSLSYGSHATATFKYYQFLASTIAFSCEDANNIKTATDLSRDANVQTDDFVEGASTGTAATFKGGIASECEITATLSRSSFDDGRILVFVEYVIGE